jgi:hypothetical protein
MTLISDQPFTSLPSNGWQGYGSYGIVADATAPQSPNNVFEMVYPAGYSSGSAPGSAEINIGGYRTVYASMYVKYSSNWQGERTTMNKIFYIVGGPNQVGWLVIRTSGTGSGPLLAGIYLQGVAAGGNFDSGATGVYTSSIDLGRSQWHLLEVIATANTGSNRDGSVSLYVDGVLASTCSGIEFAAGSPVFNYVQENPIWGGGGDVAKAAQSLRVDHFYLSGTH